MNAWRVLISGVASAVGVLAFLVLVAAEVERTELELTRWESRMRKAARQRQMQAAARKSPKTEQAA